MILFLSTLIQKNWLKAFASSGFLHLTLDFLLHNQDAGSQLWPLCDWIFISPFSLTIFLINKFGRSKLSFLLMIVALLEIAPTLIFRSI